MASSFSPATLKFLKGLARNNDRDWFEARRHLYEAELKTPMLAFIDAVNHEMLSFAPDHVRDPKKVMMRIYRDTRFAKDKRPYKRQIAAWWARYGMEKTSGGGYYMHVHPEQVMIAGGVYMPERAQLLAIREWMADNHVEYRKLLKAALRTKIAGVNVSLIDPQALTRMPKGFAADHPADELLRARNWGVHLLLPGDAALQPSLVKNVAKGFKAAAPLIDALNEAMLAASKPTKVSGNEWL